MKSIYFLLLGALIISFSPILVKLIQLGPSWIAFWRAFIATVFLLFTRFHFPSKNLKKFYLLSFFAGLTIALDLFVWHRSILLMGAGLATVLGNTQVVYMVLFSVFIYKEKLDTSKYLAILLAIIGIFFIVNVSLPSSINKSDFFLGAVFGLLTGIAYATFMLLLRKLEIEFPEMSTLQKLFWVYLFSSLVLLGLSFLGGEVMWPQPTDWPWLLTLGLVANIGGWKLITSSLPKVSPSTAGLVMLLQPAGSTLWGILFFKEELQIQQVFGILLLFAGIYMATGFKKRVK